MTHPDIAGLIPEFVRLNAAAHHATEISLARGYLETLDEVADPFDKSWINTGFTQLLAGQVARWEASGILLSNDSGCPIVVVGGGALPQTQVFLYRVTRKPVIAIERDPESAHLAQEILRRLHIPSENQVLCCDGRDFDFHEADIVVVATLVSEKIAVAKQVAATAQKCFLNLRVPVGLHAIWRTCPNLSDIEAIGWQLVDRWCPDQSSVAALTFRGFDFSI